MADKSKIEWTDATWNPLRGCSKVSKGCQNCYAMHVAHRYNKPGMAYDGLTVVEGGKVNWSGKIMLVPHKLDEPLRWTRPRMVFVNSMSDLFHPDVPDDYIDQVFAVMSLAEQHTFQVLTKRPQRMRDYMESRKPQGANVVEGNRTPVLRAQRKLAKGRGVEMMNRAGCLLWPLPNVWLGVSVEDQPTADERIPLLLETPAAIRWLSMEPLLDRISLTGIRSDGWSLNVLSGGAMHVDDIGGTCGKVDWVVVGGESGHGARPICWNWARQLRDQCCAYGVPFFFKQWGEWVPPSQVSVEVHKAWMDAQPQDVEGCAAMPYHTFDEEGAGVRETLGTPQWIGLFSAIRVGKKTAGRELDGRTWDDYPAVRS